MVEICAVVFKKKNWWTCAFCTVAAICHGKHYLSHWVVRALSKRLLMRFTKCDIRLPSTIPAGFQIAVISSYWTSQTFKQNETINWHMCWLKIRLPHPSAQPMVSQLAICGTARVRLTIFISLTVFFFLLAAIQAGFQSRLEVKCFSTIVPRLLQMCIFLVTSQGIDCNLGAWKCIEPN